MIESSDEYIDDPDINLDKDIQKINDAFNSAIFKMFLPLLERLKKTPEYPLEIIHSSSDKPDYKVRKGWFQAVSLTFEHILDNLDIYGLKIPVRTWEGMRTFTKYVTGDLREKELIPKSDVQRANRILLDVITALMYEHERLEQKLSTLKMLKANKSG